MAANFWPKKTKNVGLSQDSNQGPSREQKKVRIFCLKLYHWATKELYKLWPKYCGKIGKEQPNDLNLTLKMYKVVFSDKQITEIKKKLHIDPIFTYSHSEIALKSCRNI